MKLHKIKAVNWESCVYAFEWMHKKRTYRIGLYTPKWIEFVRPSDAWYRWKRVMFKYINEWNLLEVRVFCFGVGYLEKEKN